METVSIRLTPEELARLDEMRGSGVSRSAFMRALLRAAGPLDGEPTHIEALRLLAESARGGKVAAQIALERALRASGASEPGELEAFLSGSR